MEDIQDEKIHEEKVEEVKKSPGFSVQDKMDQAEFFFDKNKKITSYLLIGLVIIVGGFVAYKYWYMPGVEAEAQGQSFYSFMDFEKDSMNMAVKGGAKVRTSDNQNITTKGLVAIADEYGSTKAGNLAKYELGCIYMRQGKFQEAIDKFNEFDGTDIIVSAIAIGATGDCYMELNKTEEAIKYYLKAADKNSNSFSTPIYLKKAGMAYESKNQYAEALKVYERIQREYGKSTEGRDIMKFITRAKVLGNL